MTGILLKCYRCTFKSTGKYESEFKIGNVDVVLELPEATIPGTDYELLAKGFFASSSNVQYLNPILLFASNSSSIQKDMK